MMIILSMLKVADIYIYIGQAAIISDLLGISAMWPLVMQGNETLLPPNC